MSRLSSVCCSCKRLLAVADIMLCSRAAARFSNAFSIFTFSRCNVANRVFSTLCLSCSRSRFVMMVSSVCFLQSSQIVLADHSQFATVAVSLFAVALVVANNLTASRRSGLRTDGMPAVGAGNFVSEQIDRLYASFAITIFLHFFAYNVEQWLRNDLRIHIVDDFFALVICARILFVLQNAVNGICHKRFSFI